VVVLFQSTFTRQLEEAGPGAVQTNEVIVETKVPTANETVPHTTLTVTCSRLPRFKLHFKAAVFPITTLVNVLHKKQKCYKKNKSIFWWGT
jgi:hypothetical protein